MYPAPSVIIFTTLSGMGFGLLVWLGFGIPSVTGWAAFGMFALAYLLSVAGLLASAFHLGHPERALKAFTQWRTSWLSREAWASVAALVVMALYGAGLVFWGLRVAPLGWLGALLSVATLWSTAMIYAQMRSVPRWHMPLTPAMFLVFAATGGALLAGRPLAAALLLVLSVLVQLACWIIGDQRLARSGTDMASATGLGHPGKVRAFEPPHTGTNYLLKEFVFVVGRRHATRLRVAALILMAGIPLILLTLPYGWITGTLAALSHLAGVAVSRWLFFAQAEHVVGLYYGKR